MCWKVIGNEYIDGLYCLKFLNNKQMEPWKNISLLLPPVLTTERTENIDVRGIKHTCHNIIRVLSKQSPLHRESALLSRFLYKYDKKFRNDIGYRNIRKTNTALRKYLQLNLLKDLENFAAVLPNNGDDYIPTRQMLEYILTRLITFSKLMIRICVCSKQAAVYYLDRVKRGESHWMSLMPYALLSRIWSMCNILLQHTTSWYSCLHQYLHKLQPKGLNFLPSGYELPQDLPDWLDLKNLDNFGRLEWSKRKLININTTLFDEEENTFGNILEYASQLNADNEADLEDKPFMQVKDYEQLKVTSQTKIDEGQAISRDSFTLSMSKEKKDQAKISNISEDDQGLRMPQGSLNILAEFQKKITLENKGSHYFGRVTNVQSLNEFLDKEEIFRNDGNKQSLTNHLSFMQWHTLKTSLQKVCDSILNNRKIEKKLQKVWKEKCLDYI